MVNVLHGHTFASYSIEFVNTAEWIDSRAIIKAKTHNELVTTPNIERKVSVKVLESQSKSTRKKNQ